MQNAIKSKTALVLGATGGIGGTVARKLLERGWTIKALNRDVAKASANAPEFHWIQGDAMNADDVRRAAEGADLIVHGVNPPGYRNWAQTVLPMLDNTIAAAKSVGATIVFPGTVYNFGPDAFPILTEDSPQNPRTKKGALRVEMERALKRATIRGVRVIIVRAGDFFGPHAGNSWFSQGLVKAGKPITAISYPGKKGVGHQWAYLPDVAETMVRLVERGDALPAFAVYHMKGVWDADGTELIGAIERAVGRKLKVGRLPWWALPLLAPFVTFLRELMEMRYLWEQTVCMDNAHLVATLGEEPHTPLDIAVREALVSIGCIERKQEAGEPSPAGLLTYSA